ncbi:MAG: hypothetical protein KIT84_19175 [Labilithrix sp.]|nr:hypothetical protein [Labilithrix sp.]MCW5813157.1 hypothetical protein [Labilithrix sp.]
MRHHLSPALLVFGLSSGALACSASAPPAEVTAESQFSVPRVKELMSGDGLGLVASAVDRAGGVHAVVRNGDDVWYVTNASQGERRWTTKKLASTAELLASMGHDPHPAWVALQQTAIAVDEDRNVSVAFELDADLAGERVHTLMALQAINGTSQPAGPTIVAQGKHTYDLALGASRGRLQVAYWSADPNATKLDEIRYRATAPGASVFGSEVAVACTGDAAGDWTTRKQLKIDHDASGRAHVFCAGGVTLSHATELEPGSGQFGPGELVPDPGYPNPSMMGVAVDGTPHVTLLAHGGHGSLDAVHRRSDGEWIHRAYFDESVDQPPLGAWEHAVYPMANQAAQAFDRAGQPVRVALINKQSKEGALEKQTLAYFGPDLARHDVADLDPANPVWNLTLAVSPVDDDAIVLFTTLGTTIKLWVAE